MMNLLSLVSLCTLSVYVHAPTQKNTTKTTFLSMDPLQTCEETKLQSPVHIAKENMIHALNKRPLDMVTFEDPFHHGVNFSIKNSIIVGVPKYDMYVNGEQVTGNHALYAVQLFPKRLHTVEGLDTPSMELHLKFIEDLPDRNARGEYDVQNLVNAARKNKLVGVVQLVVEQSKNETHVHKSIADEFVDCLLGLAGRPSVVCEIPWHRMFNIPSGLYMYTGALMYPVCVGPVEFCILNQPAYVSAERITKIQAMLPNFLARHQHPMKDRWVMCDTPHSSQTNVAPPSVLWLAVVCCLLGARISDMFNVFCHYITS